MQRIAQRPLSGLRAKRPSIFMCPMAGSMALRRRIMALSVRVAHSLKLRFVVMTTLVRS
jgi:hypothetical protein